MPQANDTRHHQPRNARFVPRPADATGNRHRIRACRVSLMLGLSFGAVTAVLSPSPALAQCNLPAGTATIGTSPPITAIPGGGTVTCPKGSKTTASFTGRASYGATIEGFSVTVQPGAELTGQTGSRVAATLSDFAAITAGPGSFILAGTNAIIRAAPASALNPDSILTPEAILLSGDGSTIVNQGRIEAERQAIRSAFQGPGQSPATNATLRNLGEIVSTGIVESSTITLGDGADVLNTGLIRRDTSGFDFLAGQPAGQSRSVTAAAVSLGEGSLLRNEGRIEVESTATQADTSNGDGVRVFGGSRIENAGVIVAKALDGGTAVASGGRRGGTTVVNEARGLIDGSGAGKAISLSGDGNTVENRGRILGGRDGAIESSPGEGFRLVQHEGSRLIGDVTARTQEQVLKTIQEFGGGRLDPNDPADVARFQSACGKPNPPWNCTKSVQTRPHQATAEWVTNQDVTVDPAVTRFSGINTFVLDGDATLTLGQDFAAENPGAAAVLGDYRDVLTFETKNADSRIVAKGVISDATDGTRGRLAKSGDGTLVLTGKNTYSGGTTISGGTLQLDPTGSIVGDVANEGRLVFNRYTGTSSIFSGVISGSGSMEKRGQGNVTLTGENTYTGGTTIAGGLLQIGDGGTSGSIVGDVVNKGSLTFNRADKVTFGGVISGSGEVVKSGRGTLRLTGANTYTSTTVVNEGELRLDGSLTSNRIHVNDRGPDPITGAPRTPGRLTGSGSTTGAVIVKAGATVAPGDGTAGKTLTVGDLTVQKDGTIEIDAREESGTGLVADRLVSTGTATFGAQASGFGDSVIDVKFDAAATIPALEGIRVVDAANGLKGRAPSVKLDAASLPHGQNFTLDLEASNPLAAPGTFAKPGEIIPGGTGSFGTIELQVRNMDVLPQTINAQYVVINAPVVVPPNPVVLTPPHASVLVPTPNLPYLAPALIKGNSSNVTTPVIHTKGKGQTGIVVQNHGVQVGGTVTPLPQTATGTPISPGTIPVGVGNSVVTVIPPTNLGTTNFVSVTGSYAKVNQTNAHPGTTYRLLYAPHSVDVYKTPTNYGNLAPLGVSQTSAQRQVGTALTSTLPKPHARPATTDQANLVAALYPMSLGQIDDALDSIAGANEDPTFVTVLNTREFQDTIGNRLRDRRDSASGLADGVSRGWGESAVDRNVWGKILGGYAEGDYLNDSKIRTWGLLLGADQFIADDIVAGVALGYTQAGIDTGSGSDDEVSSFEAALYGSWTSGNWFVNGNIGYSYNRLEINRAANIGGYREMLSGETQANSIFAGVEVGKVLPTSWGALEPTLGLRYQYVDRDGYTETGSAALARKVSGETLHTGQGILGLRAYGDYMGAGNVSWRPELRVAYARELGDSDINGSAALVSAPGSSFDVFTAGPGEDVGILGLRLDGKGERVNYYVDYQLEAREGLLGSQFRVGFSMTF